MQLFLFAFLLPGFTDGEQGCSTSPVAEVTQVCQGFHRICGCGISPLGQEALQSERAIAAPLTTDKQTAVFFSLPWPGANKLALIRACQGGSHATQADELSEIGDAVKNKRVLLHNMLKCMLKTKKKHLTWPNFLEK